MSRFIVMDIVFYGSSLNYDQGAGNYQELKKITKWDGKQYTLVSRYALRYSLLHSSEFPLAKGNVFTQEKKRGAGERGTFKPKPELLFNGEILKYPEFDLFGFLVTNTEPQNFRESPVKISHAISMTPFNYDNHFCGNHWTARRALEAGVTDKMDINLFTKEEHETYYQYTIVVDVEKVGKLTVYTTNEKNVEIIKDLLKGEEGEVTLKTENGNEIKVFAKVKEIPSSKEKKSKRGVFEIFYELSEEERKKRIEILLKAVLNLHREIKGVPSSLSPKLMIVGVYKDKPYLTYKDKIVLADEYVEERIEEVEEIEKDGKKIFKVKHTLLKSKKPVFEVFLKNTGADAEEISEEEFLSFIKEIWGDSKNGNAFSKVKVFYDPSVEVRIK